MTRFARSKGSRGCNERIPEDSTPWNIMKKQAQHLATQDQDIQQRELAEAKRKENYEKFLKEEESKKNPETWCQFEDVLPNKSENVTKTSKKDKKIKRKSEIPENVERESTNDKKKKSKKSVNNSESDFDEDDPELVKWCDEGDSDLESKNKFNELTSQLEAVLKEPKNKKKSGKRTTEAVESLEESFQIEKVEDVDEDASVKKRKREQLNENIECEENSVKKKKKKRNNKQSNDEEKQSVENLNDEENSFKKNNQSNDANKNLNGEENSIKKKKKKRKNKQSKDEENVVEKKPQSKSIENFNSEENSFKNKRKDNNKNDFQKPDNRKFENNNKRSNGEPYARRKPLNTERSVIIVNGEEVEVSTYDGFPILAKEAERLTQLRKSLISKGIARSEVNRTMKLERRKCEKALSRIKKKMCYNCRKGGHNLSECPELNKADSVAMPSSGLCFKCGSTEHTHFACKVVKTQEYKFASCFICNEQGHISRQCPDNPKGLYPRGGGCRECGDVTHLKKDCPKIVKSKENDTIRLETLGSSNIEDIKSNSNTSVNNSTKSIKHVRF